MCFTGGLWNFGWGGEFQSQKVRVPIDRGATESVSGGGSAGGRQGERNSQGVGEKGDESKTGRTNSRSSELFSEWGELRTVIEDWPRA